MKYITNILIIFPIVTKYIDHISLLFMLTYLIIIAVTVITSHSCQCQCHHHCHHHLLHFSTMILHVISITGSREDEHLQKTVVLCITVTASSNKN